MNNQIRKDSTSKFNVPWEKEDFFKSAKSYFLSELTLEYILVYTYVRLTFFRIFTIFWIPTVFLFMLPNNVDISSNTYCVAKKKFFDIYLIINNWIYVGISETKINHLIDRSLLPFFIRNHQKYIRKKEIISDIDKIL